MYKEGDIVYGVVTNILGYGAFVTVDEEYTGLIHISEFSDNYVKNIANYIEIGERIKLKVLEVEEGKNYILYIYGEYWDFEVRDDVSAYEIELAMYKEFYVIYVWNIS